eukprot:TRINITY_DN676_c0_g4_i1.p1 TRINITY_DN676_c0_g4~~TRINITY_DN676_c0_g4_i1.p1  ORF type:complete len:325 (-),score=43.83 TRINITY_DN676_c0_g4_i1:33-1007(-)
MWKKALSGTPKVTPDEWSKLDIFTRWLIAVRAPVLNLTLFSCLISMCFAIQNGLFDATNFIAVTVAFIFEHAAHNLVNDYMDWHTGVDSPNYFRMRYGTHPMTVMSLQTMMVYMAITSIPMIICEIYLVYLRGIWAIVILGSGLFFFVFYTWPMKKLGLGEFSVFFVWSILMSGGGYFLMTGVWSTSQLIASLPYAIGVTTVVMGKHIDKLEEDSKKGINTLPVLLGEKNARTLVLGMIASQYVLVLLEVFVFGGYSKIMGIITMVSLYTIPKLYKVYTSDRPKEKPANYPTSVWPLYFVAHTFKQNGAFGLLFFIGLLIDTFL